LLSSVCDKCADPHSAARTKAGIRVRVCLVRRRAIQRIRGQRALHARSQRRHGRWTHAPVRPVHVFRAELVVRWPPKDGQPSRCCKKPRHD